MKQRTTLVAALAIAAALTACSRNDEAAADQRMDGAIAEAPAQVSGDMAITAKVNAALVADDQLKATQINVDTREGQVTLTGQAPDAQSRERATTLASAVDGVKQVNNQLMVSQNS